MASLTEFVTVTISLGSVQIERAGFGVPLILASDCPVGFTERVRFYNDVTEVDDDFATTTATYKMAAAFFAQSPKPERVAVGRMASKFTQRWQITPVAANSTVYEGTFNGNALSYTSDSSATVTEIIAGLKADIDALSLGVTVSDQTTYMRIIANTAGDVFSFQSSDLSLIGAFQDHDTSSTLATDLAAIADEDNSWYGILYPANSKADADAIADWAEANKKLFIAAVSDSRGLTLATGSDANTSTQANLASQAFERTAQVYHPDVLAFADAAWAGTALTSDPGSETWNAKTLAGVSVVTLSTTYRTRLSDKKCNAYQLFAGVNMLTTGILCSGEFVDVTRFRDWLEATMSEDITAAIAAASAAGKKIPYTDAGVAVITGIVRSVLLRGVEVGGLASDPAPKVTAPKVADISAVDKGNRLLPDIKFDGVLAGAIHKVQIRGTVSV